jgi:hypothetical protein
LGDPTPWPCFLLCIEEMLENIQKLSILNIINNKTKTFKEIANIDTILAAKFHQKKLIFKNG